jgi:RNA polymerase sigma factor (sigma-70 family)
MWRIFSFARPPSGSKVWLISPWDVMIMRTGTGDRTLGTSCCFPAGPASDGPSDGQLLERFHRDGDGAAFALLVQRHGPMVLGACRRVLGNTPDADDAFQVTFLVLVQKAASLGRPDSLAAWLHGVAHRTALKARANAARRSAVERQTGPMLASEPPDEDLSDPELHAALDEELARLPEKYRAPLVLCYLEGLTNEQAARRLGWRVGSMSYRLARGRELMRRRLDRRGCAIAPLGFPALLDAWGAAAPVPSALADATVLAALRVRLGLAAGASGTVAELADQVLHSLAAGAACGAQRAGARWLAAGLAGLALLFALGLAYGAVAPFGTNQPPADHSGPPTAAGCAGRGCPPSP